MSATSEPGGPTGSGGAGSGQGGLAWPDHDSGPTPPPQYQSRQKDEDRATRKPMAVWDRIKLLVLLLGAFAVLFWAAVASNPLLQAQVSDSPAVGLSDAWTLTYGAYWWLLALAAVEFVRQVHYFVSERSSGYHRFWTQRVFGRWNARVGRMNAWNRFRVARALKWLFVLLIVDLVAAQVLQLPPALALFQIPVLVFQALPMLAQLFFAFFFIIFQFVGLFWFLSRGGTEVYFPDDIKTRFGDVWGQDSVLDKVKENMLFLEDPESIEEKGGYVPGGVLLWGPPGTGKTLIAEAVAGETGKPYVFVDPGAFTNMFMGVGILKVKALFRKARKLALRYGGVIMFFDEADALGNRGALSQGGWGGQPAATPAPDMFSTSPACNGLHYLSQHAAHMVWNAEAGQGRAGVKRDGIMMGGMGGGGAGAGTLQALLAELSGLKKPRGFLNRVVRRALGMRPKPPPKYRIMVMMATNMPQSLDEALLRPGRIDRIYKVGYPSKVGRVRTYWGYLEKVRHHLTTEEVDKLATITPYSTGATIKDTVNESLINAIRDGRDTITWQDVIKAKQLKDLGPPEDVEYIERERHAVAVHEACHAVAAYRVRQHLEIDIATIEKGGTYLGMVASIPPEDQFTRWRSEYEADIVVSLASLAGERMFFEGDNSSGVSGDLAGATHIATFMEGYWGMGSTVANHGVSRELGVGGGKPGEPKDKEPERELLKGDLGSRIEAKLEGLLVRTENLLTENRLSILAVAHALETQKTLTGDDIAAVIEGRQGPLIDGRPYHTPDFAQLAEEYHTKVVSAHKTHARVEVALPRVHRHDTELVGAWRWGHDADEPS